MMRAADRIGRGPSNKKANAVTTWRGPLQAATKKADVAIEVMLAIDVMLAVAVVVFAALAVLSVVLGVLPASVNESF
jgi:hypothetical protein